MSNNNLDKQIAQKLDGYKASQEAGDWEKMEALLDDKPKRRIAPWWMIMGLVILVAAGSAGIFYKVGQNNGKTLSAKNETVETIAKNEKPIKAEAKELARSENIASTSNKVEDNVNSDLISESDADRKSNNSKVITKELGSKLNNTKVNDLPIKEKPKAKQNIDKKRGTKKPKLIAEKVENYKARNTKRKGLSAKSNEVQSEPKILVPNESKSVFKGAKPITSVKQNNEKLLALNIIELDELTNLNEINKLKPKKDLPIDNNVIEKSYNWKVGLSTSLAAAQFMQLNEVKQGYAFGLSIDRRIKSNMWFTTGLNYSRENYELSSFNICPDCINNVVLRNNSLEVPLQLRYEINPQNKWSSFVAVGVSHYFTLGGSTIIDFTAIDTAGVAYELQLSNGYGKYPANNTNNTNAQDASAVIGLIGTANDPNVNLSADIRTPIRRLGWNYNLSVGINHQLSNKWEWELFANYQRSIRKYYVSYDGLLVGTSNVGAFSNSSITLSGANSPFRDFARYNTNKVSFGSSIKFKF